MVKQIGTAVEANARDVKIISQRGVPVGPRGGWRALREVRVACGAREEEADVRLKIVLVDPDEKARMRVEGGEVRLKASVPSSPSADPPRFLFCAVEARVRQPGW